MFRSTARAFYTGKNTCKKRDRSFCQCAVRACLSRRGSYIACTAVGATVEELKKRESMARKCAVCGKRRASGRVIAPHEKLPEVKKEIFVCSQKCEDTFFRRIISGRKKTFREQLEHKVESATDEDYGRIWSTLTPKEQKHLAMIGFGYLRTLSDKTPAGFYKELRLSQNR